MRQRIQTIKTIKKVTHAMRLIAMSSHSHLKNIQGNLRNYQNVLMAIFTKIRTQEPLWRDPILQPYDQNARSLYIIISSQKGLCGNFNAALFELCKKSINRSIPPRIITIGKKATEFIENSFDLEAIISFDELNKRNYLSIAQQLIDHIFSIQKPYSSVVMISNFAQTFFTQLPRITNIIPIESSTNFSHIPATEYLWDQPPINTLNQLSKQTIIAQIQCILFESLIAEQAARFISMDNSTKNANNLLETTKLQYNKLRQAKITRELIELTSSLI
jgi:F-type H+-transporting ATPase subunit gamma